MACSTTNVDVNYVPLVSLFGVYFQIRDDLMNLSSPEVCLYPYPDSQALTSSCSTLQIKDLQKTLPKANSRSPLFMVFTPTDQIDKFSVRSLLSLAFAPRSRGPRCTPEATGNANPQGSHNRVPPEEDQIVRVYPDRPRYLGEADAERDCKAGREREAGAYHGLVACRRVEVCLNNMKSARWVYRRLQCRYKVYAVT